jgi:hypothetical protein
VDVVKYYSRLMHVRETVLKAVEAKRILEVKPVIHGSILRDTQFFIERAPMRNNFRRMLERVRRYSGWR